jgi:hypothetical protein
MTNDRVERTDTGNHEARVLPRVRRTLARAIWLGCVMLFAVALAGAWDSTRAQDRRADARRVVTLPVATVGLAAGDGLRTTVTNISTSAVTVEAVVVDEDGAEVERATLTIPPGASQSLETSRSEMASSDLSAMTYTSIETRQADSGSLLLTSEVIDWATGSTRFVAGAKCPSWMCGPGDNHNETMVREADGGPR